MNKYVKSFLGFFIIVIPAALTLGLLFNYLTKKSFYPDEGIFNTSGLITEVKIYSNSYGTPHIFSKNEHDAYFTLGYVHARDRLWQMDLARRVAEGRLSEIFGSKTIDFDKLFRTIGIHRFSYILSHSLSEHSKQILQNYADGVNSFIEEHRENPPIEFDALNYKPDEWKPEHSLMIARLMGWELNLAWFTDYIIGEIVNKAGLEKTSEIFPDSNITLFKRVKPPEAEQTDTLEKISASEHNIKNITLIARNFYNTYADYREFLGFNNLNGGSNCWVISGAKSESGKPIIANDPHLGFQAPSKWYEVYLNSNTLNVTGMSLPGIPGIIIGHNNYIAWGLTNLMNDDCDFILLTKDSGDKTKYYLKNQVYTYDSIPEKILVKDSAEIDFIVYLTKIGPVISDLSIGGFAELQAQDCISLKDKILTFKWTGFELADDVDAFYKINTARNWDEFKEGIKKFCVPAQNFMYADINGNIGYHAGGKIPVRKSIQENDFIFPLSEDLEWTGFIDFDNMPGVYNPNEEFIATANTNPFDWLITGQKDRFYISYIFEPASRFDKITEFLSNRSKLGINDFKLIQMSYESPYAKEISGYILEAYKNVKTDEETSKFLEKFKNWNGDLKPNSEIGTIYSLFFIMLLKNTYEDELGKEVFHDFLIIQNLPYRSIMLLLKKNSAWFDNVNTAATETRDEIIRKSLFNAIELFNEKIQPGANGSKNWGDIHTVKFRHPLGTVEALDKSFNIGPYSVGGDQTTLNNSVYSFNNALENGDFTNILGSSMRMIVDLGDVKHSLTVNTTGQNGQPLHKNYKDQTRLWLNGEYITGTTDELEMIEKKYKLLILNPAK